MRATAGFSNVFNSFTFVHIRLAELFESFECLPSGTTRKALAEHFRWVPAGIHPLLRWLSATNKLEGNLRLRARASYSTSGVLNTIRFPLSASPSLGAAAVAPLRSWSSSTLISLTSGSLCWLPCGRKAPFPVKLLCKCLQQKLRLSPILP